MLLKYDGEFCPFLIFYDFYPKAIFVLLDSEDPLFACLEKKEAFSESLFSWISAKVSEVLCANNEFPLDGLTLSKALNIVDSSANLLLF